MGMLKPPMRPGKKLKLKAMLNAKEAWRKKIRREQSRLRMQRYREKLRREAARDGLTGAVDGGCPAAEGAVDVGSVDETDDMHLARHAGLEGQNCLRCVVIHNKRRLACIAPWAKVRPSHLGGSWGLGCLVCAAGLHNPAARTARERLRKCRDSKWATFQFAELPARHAAVVEENWST